MNTKFNQIFLRDVNKYENKITKGDLPGYEFLRDLFLELSNSERRELLSDLLCVNYHSDNETILKELELYI